MITIVTAYNDAGPIVYGLIRVDGVVIGRIQVEREYWEAFKLAMKGAQFTQGWN